MGAHDQCSINPTAAAALGTAHARVPEREDVLWLNTTITNPSSSTRAGTLGRRKASGLP